MEEKFLVDYKALGHKIRQKRQQLNLSQEKVSEKLDLSESFYSRIERGDRILSVESLVKIANFYDISLDYLLLDSTKADNKNKLQSELENIFKDKSPSQSEHLLSILKVLSENINKLQS